MTDQLRTRLPWLAHGSTRRLAPALHRFAMQDWTVNELIAALNRQLALRECSLPRRIRQPELYLAWLLGAVEPVDPVSGGVARTAAIAAQKADQAAQLAHYTAQTTSRPGRAETGLAACRDALNHAAEHRRAGEH